MTIACVFLPSMHAKTTPGQWHSQFIIQNMPNRGKGRDRLGLESLVNEISY